MGLGKQSKILSDKQVKTMLLHLSTTRMSIRNQLIFLLSVKSGLRDQKRYQELDGTWLLIQTEI